jgi:ligand-binding sensor domain-containing protein
MGAGKHLRNTWWAAVLCGLALVITSDAHAERLAIKSYTIADGLPSTFVEHIVQDSHGFLRLLTRDGLSRFDGYRFVTYGTSYGPARWPLTEDSRSSRPLGPRWQLSPSTIEALAGPGALTWAVRPPRVSVNVACNT